MVQASPYVKFAEYKANIMKFMEVINFDTDIANVGTTIYTIAVVVIV